MQFFRRGKRAGRHDRNMPRPRLLMEIRASMFRSALGRRSFEMGIAPLARARYLQSNSSVKI
jgi:hypothetical protein